MRKTILLSMMLCLSLVPLVHAQPSIDKTLVVYSHRGWDEDYFSIRERWRIVAEAQLSGVPDPLTTNVYVHWPTDNSKELIYREDLSIIKGVADYIADLAVSLDPILPSPWETEYAFQVEGVPPADHSVPSGTFIDLNPPATNWNPVTNTLSWTVVAGADDYQIWFSVYEASSQSFNLDKIEDEVSCCSYVISFDKPWYWIMLQAVDEDSSLGLINESVYNTIVSNGTVPCTDSDGDGYGIPPGPECDYLLIDCDDSNPHIYQTNPNTFCDCEIPYGMGTEEICSGGIDEDCDGLIDCADQEDCGYPCTANAEATTYGSDSLTGSGVFNELVLLCIPVGAVIILRFLRRNR